MAWKIELSATAARELDKLDPPQAKRILKFLHERLAPLENPRGIGQALRGLIADRAVVKNLQWVVRRRLGDRAQQHEPGKQDQYGDQREKTDRQSGQNGTHRMKPDSRCCLSSAAMRIRQYPVVVPISASTKEIERNPSGCPNSTTATKKKVAPNARETNTAI